jgi:glycosyltransferase involved in cell wall biosynthesis
MKTALIATVFNEASSIDHWLESLAAQTKLPQEIIIVDGGSTDGTPLRITEFFSKNERLHGKGRLIQRKCNIAEGRNLAVAAASSEVVACTDAGSILDPAWFQAMIEPFERGADLVSGWTETQPKNRFQEKLKAYADRSQQKTSSENYLPSSRTIAFRKTVWEAVGRYPEWLTLTGEDALFNENLKVAGFKFIFQPAAVAYWEPRPTMASFLKQMYSYGFGAAEARLFGRHYFRWMLTTFCPPLILFSKHTVRDIPFRFLRNAASSLGWLAGKIAGKKPPSDWKVINGVLLSPETQAVLSRRDADRGSLSAASV